MNKITFFRDEYRLLSNFYQCPFEYKGLTCPNAFRHKSVQTTRIKSNIRFRRIP